jgi:hypothetical protein
MKSSSDNEFDGELPLEWLKWTEYSVSGVFTPEREGGDSVVGVLVSKGVWGEEVSGENDPSLMKGRASMTGNNLRCAVRKSW